MKNRESPSRLMPTPSRRRFVQLLLGSAVLHSGAMPAAGRQLDLSNETDLLSALIKMRGSLGPELVIGWVRAKRFGVSQGRVEPVCGLVAATFNRFNRLSDELFEVLTLEITHYTDFATGELLDTVVMPFSNREVEVPAYRFGPTKARFAVRLDEKEDFAPAEQSTEGDFSPAGSVLMTKSIDPPQLRRGSLFLRHEEHGRVYPTDSKLPSMFYKESTIWSAPADAVLDADTLNVDSTVGYSAMTSWRPWMDMGGIPGHTTSNGFGGKARSVSDLPADFLRYTEQVHPDVLEDPGAALDAFEG
jgi:hypothetical protein